MRPLRIQAFTATSCLGAGLNAHRQALLQARSGLAPLHFEDVALQTYAGAVADLDSATLPEGLSAFDCRNNRLALLGLQQDGFDTAVRQAVARLGPSRIGVFVGTSTSGLLQTELAYRQRDSATGALPSAFRYPETHNTNSLAAFVQALFGLRGPASVQSVACASSARVFGIAERAIRAGVIDAALVGGVDTLCLTTLYGFNSLELLSSQPCRPYDRDRDGISIGEAAAFALLEPADAARSAGISAQTQVDNLWLTGYGESSDAHHMSSPHPEGDGARRAMAQALASAGVEPTQVDYVNLHGTATPGNDAAEDAAVANLFGDRVPVSSTKGAHGHALGAAGALEAVVSLLCLSEGLIPAGLNRSVPDPALRARYQGENQRRTLTRVLSNSFGFGGANCALLFERGKSC